MLDPIATTLAVTPWALGPRGVTSSQRTLMFWLLGATALVAGAALLGWAIGSIELVAFVPVLPTMKANTAIAFLALSVGMAASLLAPSARAHPLRVIGLGLALAIGVLSLAQSALRIDLGIDQWVLVDRFPRADEPPGRPAPATAVALIALAIGALMPGTSRWCPLPVGLAFLIGYLATIGHLLEASWTGSLGQVFTTVSIPTAACILMLSAVLLAGMAWRGTALERLGRGTAGAQLLRAALPVTILAPAAVMWLQYQALRQGWWDAAAGLAVAATVTALVFIAIAARGARWIDRLQADLRAANERLQVQVAQRTQALAAAQQAHDTVEATLRTRADFLSHVSHELRTPLNAILGFAQLLQLDGEHRLDDHQRLQLSHVETAGRQLKMLVDDLLDFAHVDAGRAPIARRSERAEELVRLAAQQIGPEAARAGIPVHVEAVGEATDAWIDVDRGRLMQVLTNLLSNAIKYNRSGGSVRVELRREAGEVVIAVADSGEGLTPDQMAQLFVPFNRLGREGGRVPGSGIGLALAQRLTGMMGGRIEATSQPGVGSVFSVRLPAASPP